jgi:hypothetical protein
MGSFVGVRFDVLEAEQPAAWRALRTRDPEFTPPGGESHTAVRRARSTWPSTDILAAHPSGVVVVVSHGVALHHVAQGTAARRATTGLVFLASENCAVHRFDWREFGRDAGLLPQRHPPPRPSSALVKVRARRGTQGRAHADSVGIVGCGAGIAVILAGCTDVVSTRPVDGGSAADVAPSVDLGAPAPDVLGGGRTTSPIVEVDAGAAGDVRFDALDDDAGSVAADASRDGRRRARARRSTPAGATSPSAAPTWSSTWMGADSPARPRRRRRSSRSAPGRGCRWCFFAHGFQLAVGNYDGLLAHLASWGYVVVSVDYPGSILAVDHRNVPRALIAARTSLALGRRGLPRERHHRHQPHRGDGPLARRQRGHHGGARRAGLHRGAWRSTRSTTTPRPIGVRDRGDALHRARAHGPAGAPARALRRDAVALRAARSVLRSRGEQLPPLRGRRADGAPAWRSIP